MAAQINRDSATSRVDMLAILAHDIHAIGNTLNHGAAVPIKLMDAGCCRGISKSCDAVSDEMASIDDGYFCGQSLASSGDEDIRRSATNLAKTFLFAKNLINVQPHEKVSTDGSLLAAANSNLTLFRHAVRTGMVTDHSFSPTEIGSLLWLTLKQSINFCGEYIRGDYSIDAAKVAGTLLIPLSIADPQGFKLSDSLVRAASVMSDGRVKGSPTSFQAFAEAARLPRSEFPGTLDYDFGRYFIDRLVSRFYSSGRLNESELKAATDEVVLGRLPVPSLFVYTVLLRRGEDEPDYCASLYKTIEFMTENAPKESIARFSMVSALMRAASMAPENSPIKDWTTSLSAQALSIDLARYGEEVTAQIISDTLLNLRAGPGDEPSLLESPRTMHMFDPIKAFLRDYGIVSRLDGLDFPEDNESDAQTQVSFSPNL